jgi:hypothetical protein
MARELLANNDIDAVLQGAYFIWLEPLVRFREDSIARTRD